MDERTAGFNPGITIRADGIRVESRVESEHRITELTMGHDGEIEGLTIESSRPRVVDDSAATLAALAAMSPRSWSELEADFDGPQDSPRYITPGLYRSILDNPGATLKTKVNREDIAKAFNALANAPYIWGSQHNSPKNIKMVYEGDPISDFGKENVSIFDKENTTIEQVFIGKPGNMGVFSGITEFDGIPVKPQPREITDAEFDQMLGEVV